MCVDQNDHAKKVYEIQQMHKIYQNAFCTIALVPELEFLGVDKTGSQQANINVIMTSEWSKRMWTLEEAYMSRDILFVGRNIHLWSRTARYYVGPTHLRAEAFLFNICTPLPNWRASTALWFTRSRTSSKAHDRIFALANIFPDLMADIEFDYKQPLLDLMIKFYALLAQKDLSVLCFGSPIDSDTNRQREAKLLPSWTGALGGHIPQKSDNKKHLRTRFTNYNVSGRYIRCQSCNCIPITIVSAEHRDCSSSTVTKDGLPYFSPSEDDFSGLYYIRPRENTRSLVFVNTTAISQDHHNYRIKTFGLRATHFLPMSYNYHPRQNGNDWLNESHGTHVGGWLSITEDCSECFMLSEMSFSIDGDHWYAFPIIKKNGYFYKSIGVCVTRGIYVFDGSLRQRLADFVIQ